MSEEPTAPFEVNQVELGSWLGDVGPQHVRELADKGVVVRIARGRFDLKASVQGFAKYMRQKTVGRAKASANPENELDVEKVRIARARAETAEIELKLVQGKVLDTATAEKVFVDMIANARAKLLSIPGKAATRIQDGDNIQARKSVVELLIHEALNELADYDPNRITELYIQENRPNMEAAAKDNGLAVG